MKNDGVDHTHAYRLGRTNNMYVNFEGETFDNIKKLAE